MPTASSAIHDLAGLLAPADLREFLEHAFQQRPVVLQRGDPDCYAGLLRPADVEFLIESPSATEKRHWLQLTRNGQSLPMATLVDEHGGMMTGRVMEALHEGYTLVLNQVHRRAHHVGMLCRGIEALFDGD